MSSPFYNDNITYELNKTYTFELSNIAFDIVPPDKLNELFKDGRHASHILELWVVEKFKNIHPKNEKNHDFIDDCANYLEAKCFTRNGCKFMPSRMIGVSRKLDLVEAHEVVKSNIYVLMNICDMPTIRIRFVKGKDLLKKYPKCVIAKSKSEEVY